MHTSLRPPRVRFGRFELDPVAGELFRRGTRLRLQEQPLQVLIALLERPGELVTREELRERLWKGNTFVDFEHGLNTAVKKARQALGDCRIPRVHRDGCAAGLPLHCRRPGHHPRASCGPVTRGRGSWDSRRPT
jgi:DNA-binding response OmpR family regulator